MKQPNNDEKTIQIRCKGSGELSIKMMSPLQGDLKSLSDENLKKIKNEILFDGFSFPICIWEDPAQNKLFILDGHQRHRALLSLQKDGYIIPQIPIVMVEADSYDQAKHKLLAAASVYGKVNTDSFILFLSDTTIKIQDVIDNLKIDVDMSKFVNEYVEKTDLEINKVAVAGHTREIKNSSKELNVDDYQQFDHVCPKCSFEWNE